ncbi:MAG: hypothetical protein CVU65_12670 [Deltaproteobacteria bacterium HGW-Deltaproteobacteria-22]|nr:MAG: hypothetical protein CVU65_12670 [Deltaproteobacteria bacterium HGW-Deltaproteobacteria-22]
MKQSAPGAVVSQGAHELDAALPHVVEGPFLGFHFAELEQMVADHEMKARYQVTVTGGTIIDAVDRVHVLHEDAIGDGGENGMTCIEVLVVAEQDLADVTTHRQRLCKRKTLAGPVSLQHREHAAGRMGLDDRRLVHENELLG